MWGRLEICGLAVLARQERDYGRTSMALALALDLPSLCFLCSFLGLPRRILLFRPRPAQGQASLRQLRVDERLVNIFPLRSGQGMLLRPALLEPLG